MADCVGVGQLRNIWFRNFAKKFNFVFRKIFLEFPEIQNFATYEILTNNFEFREIFLEFKN